MLDRGLIWIVRTWCQIGWMRVEDYRVIDRVGPDDGSDRNVTEHILPFASLSLSFFFLEWFVIGRIIFFFSFFLFIMLPLLLGLRWRDKAMTMITILLPFHLDGQQLRRSFLPPVAFSFSFYFLFCFLSSIWWIPIGYRPSPHIYSRSRYVYRYDMLIDSNLPVQRHLLPRASIPDSGLWLVHDHLQFQHILFIFIFNVDLY